MGGMCGSIWGEGCRGAGEILFGILGVHCKNQHMGLIQGDEWAAEFLASFGEGVVDSARHFAAH